MLPLRSAEQQKDLILHTRACEMTLIFFERERERKPSFPVFVLMVTLDTENSTKHRIKCLPGHADITDFCRGSFTAYEVL